MKNSNPRFLLLLLLFLIFVATIFGSTYIVPTHAVASFSASTSPSPINVSEQTTIFVTVTGGTANSPYQFKITVSKPGGVGVATNTLILNTNSTGSGTGAIVYPYNLPAWTTVSGSPAGTDVTGTYTVSVDETAPKAATGVASTSFIVKNNLTISILSPTSGTSYSRGNSVTITAEVRDVQGTLLAGATVSANTPSGSIQLSPSSPPGRYSNSYTLQQSDAVGNWNITVNASWPSSENTGSASVVVAVTGNQLVISDLATYNANGTPISDFNPGDTLYASFRVAISGTNLYLTSGSITVHIRNPSGSDVATLVCIYDPNRGVFYTPSGFQVSSSDPTGAWFLVFPANSITDSYGNTGPIVAVTYRFQIHQPIPPSSPTSTISSVWYTIIGLIAAGVLGSLIFLKRFNVTNGPFEDLFKLTGGEIQPPTTLMIISDSGAGSTTLALELLYRDLSKGKYGGLLAYDAFPSQIQKNMKDMGWDITSYVRSGQLKIVDCYSANAGVESSGIVKDPSDFTEVSIQVTHLIEKAKGPLTLVFDSTTPIFTAAEAKDCINFLQVLGAKLKNNGGTFIFTATKGSIPEEARSKTESLADGVIELSLVKKTTGLARYLLVKKMAGRQTASVETPYEIKEGRGILIRKQRIPVGLFRP